VPKPNSNVVLPTALPEWLPMRPERAAVYLGCTPGAIIVALQSGSLEWIEGPGGEKFSTVEQLREWVSTWKVRRGKQTPRGGALKAA
jgi:hypothetical protein